MSAPRYTIVRVVQTSFACPSQWDAWTDTGQYLYLRYRHGVGTVDSYDNPDPRTWPFKSPEIVFTHGGVLDGVMELAQFAELAGLVLAEGADTGETMFTVWMIGLNGDE